MSAVQEFRSNTVAPFRTLGNDLFVEIDCECLDPKFAEFKVAHLFKTKVRLTGYNDDYFFEKVNEKPRTVNCPTCKRQLFYQWTRDGVMFAWKTT